MRVVRRVFLTAAVCAGLAACSNRGGTASRSVPAANREVSFVVDGTTTYGTLDVPEHRAGQRLAAALLLAGSGPTDRNGDQASGSVQPHTLQFIAEALDKMGIISLRFDKYFSGRTGGGSYAAAPEKITLGAFINQGPRSARSRTGRRPTRRRRRRPPTEVVRVSQCHKAATHGLLALANQQSADGE